MEHEAELVVAFATGVQERCSACKVYPTGQAANTLSSPAVLRYLELLAPAVRDGRLENAIDVHYYFGPRAVADAAAADTRPDATDRFFDQTLDLAARAGWPEGTVPMATEMMAHRHAYPAGISTEAWKAAAGEAVAGVLRRYEEAGAPVVCPFSLMIYGDRALRDNYDFNPDDPVGRAVRAFTVSSSSSGGPGGVVGAESAPMAEEPWYCRWFGLGCG